MSVDTAYRVRPLHRGDPRRLGGYRLTGRLGSGGMGVVYLGLDPDDGYVAIKLVHATLAQDAESRRRFRNEVERARQVPSFCTAEVLDADLDHNPPYLVVEYVDGPSLTEAVDERGPLTAANLHSVAVGVATALTGIHGAGVIHRDLKPQNVLLAPGSPKVIDFGIARALAASSRHTRTDQTVGTVAYMAPERFSARPGTDPTAAADVFAWGCVVGYAGTGQTPFHGDSPSATAGRILTQPPHLDGLAEPLRALVELALAKEPEDRPTARELLDMLLGDRPMPHLGPAAAGARRRTAVMDRPDPLRPACSHDQDDRPPRRAGVAAGHRAWTRQPHGARWPAFLAVLLVVAGIGTVAAVLGAGREVGDAPVAGARQRDDGSGAWAGAPISGAPPATAPASARPSAAPPARPAVPTTIRPATREPAPVEPSTGEVIIRDRLNQPGQWRDSEIRADGAKCFTRGVLRAARIDRGTFQCAGPQVEIGDDVGVAVSTALQNAGSCAAIWFHWTPGYGGHVLRICQDAMSVAADRPDDRRVFGTLRLATPIPVKKSVRVHLVVRDGRAEIYRSGGYVGSVHLPQDSDAGQVRLGISVESPHGKPPYTVTFADVDIRSL
jgi:hypothetical protein